MKKLLFSLMALTIGAFTFISCDKEDDLKEDINKEKEREKEQGDTIKSDTLKVEFLSLEQQKGIVAESIYGLASVVNFSDLAGSIDNILESIGDENINWGFLGDALEEDSVFMQKFNAFEAMLSQNEGCIDFESIYMVADIAFEAVTYYDTVYYVSEEGGRGMNVDTINAFLPYIENIDYDADHFQVNLKTPSRHVIVLSLTGTNDTQSRFTYKRFSKISTVKLPNSINLSLTVDGKNVISANGKYETDFQTLIEEGKTDAGENEVEKVMIYGTSIVSEGAITIDKYSLSGNATYDPEKGFNVDFLVKAGEAAEMMNVKANLNATLVADMNWVDEGALMSWAVNPAALRGGSVDVKFGGDQIEVVAALKENPIQYNVITTPIFMLAAGSQPDQAAMTAMVDKFNEIFSGDIYFKGFKDPQAKLTLGYHPTVGGETAPIALDLEGGLSSILNQVVTILANSGLFIGVTALDAEGNECTSTLNDYFSQVDADRFTKILEENILNAIKPLAEKYSRKEVGYIK